MLQTLWHIFIGSFYLVGNSIDSLCILFNILGKTLSMNIRSACHVFLYFFLVLFTSHTLTAQSGVVTHTDQTQEGYVLLKKPGSAWDETLTEFYLIDNCGRIINFWDGFNGYYLHAKLLSNGNILFFNRNTIYEKNWENELLNEVELVSQDIALDYEVIKLENGNYLSVGRKSLSPLQFEELGFTPDNGNPYVVDVVIEVDSVSGNIVWEWDISDHCIQERDPSKVNYGIVAEHPELLDIDAISLYDWQFDESFMINGFDYNPELEQVMVSVRKMSEVVIIDRTTTTEEAAGHTGGKYGKGGDVLFRWGNPGNYIEESVDERKLYFQHNPKWITKGPHKGKISIFNNGLNRDFDGPSFSEGKVVDTHVNADGNYSLDENNQFSSGEAFHNYKPTNPDDFFYTGYLSGVEMMPNGNAFFTIGESRSLYELTMEGEIVWQFNYPFNDEPFRTEKYLLDYPAFANRDLTPGNYLPNVNPNLDCMLTSDVKDDLYLLDLAFVQYHNESIQISNPGRLNLTYQLLNYEGKSIARLNNDQAQELIDLSLLSTGIYLLNVIESATGKFRNYSFVVTSR